MHLYFVKLTLSPAQKNWVGTQPADNIDPNYQKNRNGDYIVNHNDCFLMVVSLPKLILVLKDSYENQISFNIYNLVKENFQKRKNVTKKVVSALKQEFEANEEQIFLIDRYGKVIENPRLDNWDNYLKLRCRVSGIRAIIESCVRKLEKR